MIIAHYQITSPGSSEPQQRYFLGNSLERIRDHMTSQFGERAVFSGLVIHEPIKNPQLRALLTNVETAIQQFEAHPNGQVVELTMPELPPHMWQTAT